MKRTEPSIARAQGGRVRPAGIGIVVAGALLLIAAMQFMRGGSHPLSATVGYDLCGRLGPQPASDRPELRGDPQQRIPDFGATRSSTCYWPIAAGEADRSPRHVALVMTTHQSLRAEGNGRGTRHYVETFLGETAASGNQVVAVGGPWKTAAVIRPRAGNELQLLAEDDGVALWLLARDIDQDALVAFAAAVARRLREKS